MKKLLLDACAYVVLSVVGCVSLVFVWHLIKWSIEDTAWMKMFIPIPIGIASLGLGVVIIWSYNRVFDK